MKEKDIKKQVKKILKDLGCYWVMPMGTGFSKSGAPDFVGCYKGHFFGIECKTDLTKNPPTALQSKHYDLIYEAGGESIFIDAGNVMLLASWIKTLPNRHGQGTPYLAPIKIEGGRVKYA